MHALQFPNCINITNYLEAQRTGKSLITSKSCFNSLWCPSHLCNNFWLKNSLKCIYLIKASSHESPLSKTFNPKFSFLLHVFKFCVKLMYYHILQCRLQWSLTNGRDNLTKNRESDSSHPTVYMLALEQN